MIEEIYMKAKKQSGIDGGTQTIILADDNVFCNEGVKNLIERCGDYKVLPFYNGLAVRHLRNESRLSTSTRRGRMKFRW